MFSLAKIVLTSVFSNSILLVGEIKIVVLEESILEEQKSYLKLV